MTDERIRGATNTAKGTVNEGVGKLTGNRKLEVKGKVQQVQGKAQKGLGDAQAGLRKGSDRG